MRATIRIGLVALLAAGTIPLTGVPIHAQAPAPTPKPKSAAPAAPATKGAVTPTPKVEAPPAPALLGQVLATVNGEKITRGDLIDFLSRYQIPPSGPEQIYRDSIETLINTKLIGMFLARQRIPVPPEKLNEAIAQLERDLKSDGRDLKTALQESGQTMDDLRREYTDRLRWIEYLNLKGTDAELKKFAANNKDLINGTQIRASHIFLKVPPGASPADEEKIKQKLVALKQDIEGKKISFAEAANKSSEDPANAEKAGGDIGYFSLTSGVVEEFANAAFALKPEQISDPIESGHGYHLIKMTDRKEGAPVDFEQQKTFIRQMYAAELQKQILTAERKSAQIDIKPMPADLFPAAPPAATPVPTPAPAPAPAPGTPK